jgi:hypothetical protein
VDVAQRKYVKNSGGSWESTLTKAETFVPLSQEELSLQEERIKRIRECVRRVSRSFEKEMTAR